MEVQQTIRIQGIEFVVKKMQVVVSPPDPSKPKRFYANINPVDRRELAPICFAINGCWRNSDFVDEIVARGSNNCQSVTGFWFFDPDEYEEEPPPEIRIDLESGQRGVITYYLEESAEFSDTFFAKLAVAFVQFCIENGIESRHTQSDLDRIRVEFKINE